MNLKFRHALFAAGAVLICIGVFSLIVGSAPPAQNPGMVDAFARGFDSIFLALFSGVLIGIGIALVGNGLLLRLLGNKEHIFMSVLFFLLFLSISTFSVFFRDVSQLLVLVYFFACISASAAFLFTSLWYTLLSAAQKYLLK